MSDEDISSFMRLDHNEFKCLIFPGRGIRCAPKYHDRYRQAYQLWKHVMSYTFEYECKTEEPELTSDNFVRQNEIIALYHGEDIVGLCMLDSIDLSFESTREHSYFKEYPAPIIKKLINTNCHSLAIASNLTINFSWRRSKIGRGASEIVFGLIVKRFHESSQSALLSYTRNDRNTNHLVYSFGATPLYQEHMSHGIASDVIIITKESLTSHDNIEIQQLISNIYNKKISAFKYTQVPNHELMESVINKA